MKKPRLVLIGNSHTRAVRGGDFGAFRLEVHWLKASAESKFGDLSLPEAEALVAALSPRDILGLMHLGTFHNIMGLVNHEVPFTFLHPGLHPGSDPESEAGGDPARPIIPLATLRAFLRDAVTRESKVGRLSALAPCRVVHFMTPPPKETLPDPKVLGPGYGKRSVYELGFAPAPQRLALWQIEAEEVGAYLGRLGVHHVLPPPETRTAAGYLAPAFGASDVTHANKAFGQALIADFANRVLPGYGPFTPRPRAAAPKLAARPGTAGPIPGILAEARAQGPDTPCVWIIGDSHTGALVEAVRAGLEAAPPLAVRVLRLRKTKNGITFGDIDMPDLERLIEGVPARDRVVSMIGGNHHQTIGLAQHPLAFCVAGPEGDADLRPERVLVPRAALSAALLQLQKQEFARIAALVRHSKAPVFHVFSPPPRERDEELLVGRTSGPLITAMLENGVSPPELRMAFWQMQNALLRETFAPQGLRFIPPPPETLNARGFLLRPYQSDDRTHANPAYGARLLGQILGAVAGAVPPAPEEGKLLASGVTS